MSWKVDFYDLKVFKDIQEWPPRLRARFARIVRLIEKNGPNEVGMPHIKALGQGLFEIRAKSDEGIARAIFCILKGKILIILNGFIKKTDKTPSNELELARRRMKEVKRDE